MNAAELAGRLGLRKRPQDYRGDCPACGYPAFSIHGRLDQRARVACFACGDAEGISAALLAVTAGSWTPPGRPAAPTASGLAHREQRARDLWDAAIPPREDGPVARYLASRGLAGLKRSAALRSATNVSHPQGGLRLLAMVASVLDVQGRLTGGHRTYLTREGRKADVDPVKASLGTIAGGAIRLHPHDPARPLVVGEGIESAASAGILLQAPAWAAVSTSNMSATMALPEDVRDVMIAVDPDPPGERAAQAAADRWMAEGRQVRLARVTGDGDWNDCLMRELSRG